MMWFVLVNFRSETELKISIQSIELLNTRRRIVVIDNSSSEKYLGGQLGEVEYVCSGNIGYGRALNKGLRRIRAEVKETDVVFCMNADVVIENCGDSVVTAKERFFVPEIRNRRGGYTKGIFLKLPSRYICKAIAETGYQSNFWLFRAVAFVHKLILWLPARVYATHGCCFAFSGKVLALSTEDIFNENTFLYSEELEYAEFMYRLGVMAKGSNIKISHVGGVSTGVELDRSKKQQLFYDSMINWKTRWWG